MDAEQAVIIRPHAVANKAGRCGQLEKFTDAVLIGILGMDALSGREIEALLSHRNRLRFLADKMHLDTSFLFVIERMM